MRPEYIVVTFVIALVVILLAISMLSGVVPGIGTIFDMFGKSVK